MKTESEITAEPKVEAYSFSKEKLPKELSYPLKRSLLDFALHAASVYETVWFVRYSKRHNGHSVLNAYFSPEQYSYAASGKIAITIWAVPAKERNETENLLLSQALPALCQWLERSRSEGNVWRGSGHGLTLECADKILRCTVQ